MKMMMDDSELERIYSIQIQEEVSRQNKLAVTQCIAYFPSVFGLDSLISPSHLDASNVHEKMTVLYQQVCESFIDHGLSFDHVWVNVYNNTGLIWFFF